MISKPSLSNSSLEDFEVSILSKNMKKTCHIDKGSDE